MPAFAVVTCDTNLMNGCSQLLECHGKEETICCDALPLTSWDSLQITSYLEDQTEDPRAQSLEWTDGLDLEVLRSLLCLSCKVSMAFAPRVWCWQHTGRKGRRADQVPQAFHFAQTYAHLASECVYFALEAVHIALSFVYFGPNVVLEVVQNHAM
jgi:hypothetical protein